MPFYKQNETKDLPFDPTKVASSCNGRFTYNAAGEWRWMTDEENATFEAKEAVDADQTFDHHRHDDDGHGSAIGARPVADDNDLGKDWGKSSIGEAFEAGKSGDVHRVITGTDALAELPAVFETAAKMLAEAQADPVNTRFALIQYKIEGTDPETLKGGRITSTMALNTVGEQAIIDYAQMLAWEKLAKEVEEAANAPTSMEIN